MNGFDENEHGASDYYMAEDIIPMVRRVFPTVVNADGTMMGKFPLSDNEKRMLCDNKFYSKKRMKKLFRQWRPSGRSVVINRAIYDGDKPIEVEVSSFMLPEEIDGFMVKMGDCADLHGIVKITSGGVMAGPTIWVKPASNPSELNIDCNIMDKIITEVVESWRKKHNRSK